MRTPLGVTIFIAIMLLLDTYVFQAIKTVSQNVSPKTRTIIYAIYWSLSVIAVISFLLFVYTGPEFLGKKVRTYLFATVIGLFLAKLVGAVFFLVDDVRRGIQWIAGKLFFNNTEVEGMSGDGISRSAFLSWVGLTAGGTLFGSLLYGFSNKYNYQVKRLKMAYDNLPASFKGLKIVHISDIHSGSFTDKKAVNKGVQKILDEKPDIILFTGDLVNDRSTEMTAQPLTQPASTPADLGKLTTRVQNLENDQNYNLKAFEWKLDQKLLIFGWVALFISFVAGFLGLKTYNDLDKVVREKVNTAIDTALYQLDPTNLSIFVPEQDDPKDKKEMEKVWDRLDMTGLENLNWYRGLESGRVKRLFNGVGIVLIQNANDEEKFVNFLKRHKKQLDPKQAAFILYVTGAYRITEDTFKEYENLVTANMPVTVANMVLVVGRGLRNRENK